MSDTAPANLDRFVERISLELVDIEGQFSRANQKWWAIAAILVEARGTGIKGKQFAKLCLQSKLGYPSGTKLVKIGSSERIKAHADQLIPRCDSWGTLYPIALMNLSEFERFSKAHLETNDVQPITRRLVNSFRSKPAKAPKFALSIALNDAGTEEEKIALAKVSAFFSRKRYRVVPSKSLQDFIDQNPDCIRIQKSQPEHEPFLREQSSNLEPSTV
jgi:hypothetical protein